MRPIQLVLFLREKKRRCFHNIQHIEWPDGTELIFWILYFETVKRQKYSWHFCLGLFYELYFSKEFHLFLLLGKFGIFIVCPHWCNLTDPGLVANGFPLSGSHTRKHKTFLRPLPLTRPSIDNASSYECYTHLWLLSEHKFISLREHIPAKMSLSYGIVP